MSKEPLFWPREAASLLGVTPKVLTAWVRKGRIGYVKTIGGQRRFPRSELIRVLREHGHQDPEQALDKILATRLRIRRR